MLATYTFVSSTVFQALWNGFEGTGPAGDPINLFPGLTVFTESERTAQASILSDRNNAS